MMDKSEIDTKMQIKSAQIQDRRTECDEEAYNYGQRIDIK